MPGLRQGGPGLIFRRACHGGVLCGSRKLRSSHPGFLDRLDGTAGHDVAFLTSPTADKGSIDAITTEVAHRENVAVGYVTADSYLQYVNPQNFPETIDKGRLAATPKFSMPDADIYSRATAELSQAILVTGGRNASVNDFMNAIQHGNRAVVLTSSAITSPAWDGKKNRVDNASAYLESLSKGESAGARRTIRFT